MAEQAVPTPNARWSRTRILLAVVAALLLIYALAGFLLAPWLIARELPGIVEQKTHHRLRIGEIAINPFTLSVHAGDVALTDPAGKTVIGLGKADLRLRWASLVRRAWLLDEVRLSEPLVRLEISEKGALNLAALAPPDDAGSGPAQTPRFALGHVVLENGRLDFEDKRERYSNTIEHLAFELSSLTTLDEERGPYTLVGETPKGAKLSWKGEIALTPLVAAGTLALQRVSLPELTPYLNDAIAGQFTAGVADLELPYRFTLAAGKPQFVITGAKLTAREPAFAEPRARTPLIKLASLALEDVHYDLDARKMGARVLRFSSGKVAARRDANGVIDLLRAFGSPSDAAAKPAARPEARPAAKPEAKPGAAQPGWQTVIDTVELDQIDADLIDEAMRVPNVTHWRGLNAKFKLDIGASRVRLGPGELTLASAQHGAVQKPPSVVFSNLSWSGIRFDTEGTAVEADTLRVGDIRIDARRDAQGNVDLAQMFTPRVEVGRAFWKVAIGAIELPSIAVSYTDQTAPTPLLVAVRGAAAKLKVAAKSDEGGLNARVDPAELTVAEVRAGASAQQQPALTIGNIAVSGTRFDSAANTLDIDSAKVGSFNVDATLDNGKLSLLALLPAGGTSGSGGRSAGSAKPLATRVKAAEVANGGIGFTDRGSGLALALERVGVKLTDASSDGKKPLQFDAGATVKSGGRITVRGRVTPATGAVDARVEAAGLTLTPLAGLLAAYPKAKLASGEVSAAGTVASAGKGTSLGYSGSLAITDFALEEADGTRLIGWKSAGTDSLRITLSPNRLDIDELRVVAPSGRIQIAADRSTNFGRAFARKDATPPAASPAPESASPKEGQAPAAGAAPEPAAQKEGQAPASPAAPSGARPQAQTDSFPVAIRQVRIEQGQLDFSDATVSQGFTAKIHELAGTIDSISSDRSTRGNFTLEGRVDEFGYAHLSGSLNPFELRDRTNARVQFRNLDLTRASPYSMKFAGYRIASGRLSLDLNYRVRQGLLEGDNHIVLEQFALGERVESPDALKLPLELAVSLLKDDEGRIDVALPVKGSLDDPKFDYGAIIGTAIRNLLVGIITAPFRALARLFGGKHGEEVAMISFEPGKSRLLPPEREKLERIVEALAKRPELKVVIPGRYDTEADARALKRAALTRDVSRRAGLPVSDDEDAGLISTEDRATRSALRALFAERFSSAELDKLKAEAEAKAGKADDGKAQQLGVIDKLKNFATGEPQVADAREFYATLVRRLRDAQPLPADALAGLAQRRADAIAEGLKTAGVDPGRVALSKADPVSRADAKEVTIQLELAKL